MTDNVSNIKNVEIILKKSSCFANMLIKDLKYHKLARTESGLAL